MKSKNYIGSQQHWEDCINEDYDERERRLKEQIDDRQQEDNRVQCQKTMRECEYSCLSKCFLIDQEG